MANVLLVDDDGSVLLTLAITLRRRGHSVTAASDAEQALRLLENHHYQYLITDVRMPGMSGFELATRVKKMNDAPRVILTSAHYQSSPRHDTAEAFLQKPVDTDRLDALLCAQERRAGGAGTCTSVRAL